MNEVEKYDDDVEYSDQEDDAITEIPKEERYLHTQAYDKSISDLIAMMRNNDIALDPEYQRNYIWDNKKASLLIESILLNVPIPVIYVAEEQDSRWTVIDGLQRLNSIRRFADNELRLSGLEVLADLKGSQYSKLNTKASRIFRNGIIRIIVVLQDSHPEIKYDIFLRLNRGSVRLNEQELRNCLYRGKFNDMLKNLRKYPVFQECLGITSPYKRFNDAELVLRYFALSDSYNKEKGKIVNYQNRMRTFLNSYMGSKNDFSDEDKVVFENKFMDTVNKVNKIFGKNAFRREDIDGNIDARVNRALMDVIMLGFEQLPEDYLIDHKTEILMLYRELPARDLKFHDSITYGTNDTSKLEYRINTWLKNLDKIFS